MPFSLVIFIMSLANAAVLSGSHDGRSVAWPTVLYKWRLGGTISIPPRVNLSITFALCSCADCCDGGGGGGERQQSG